ncbi:SGNH/GDSL hydrolase family protein [Rhodococcus kroppenstedtii]|uniref:SGNH/GDSL hydrolase family protein n=1 Tax=Rhodococcoides kroppenstedtii TaxID=293050 RepID=UPI001C9B6CD4|nr:SGNH/GDSL hydrolase family protein [Rhodococcus kroppenstedtii]MBY6437558.1 SGNH/GDSL hydrolase family protein [Rhodococcus kroppenstedtii]
MSTRGRIAQPPRRVTVAVVVACLVAVGAAFALNQTRATEPTTTISNPVDPAKLTARPGNVVLPDDPRMLILGDSYTLGTAASPDYGYANIVARRLGWPAEVDGIGGTGFTWGGGSEGADGNTYRARIERRAGGFAPNVLLLQGGQNDYRATPDEVRAAVTETIDTARRVWPGVQILVMGPSQPMPGGALLRRVSDPIGQAAVTADAGFISPLDENWFTDQNSPGFYGDANGAHPNTAGHEYIADRVLERFRRLGASVSDAA